MFARIKRSGNVGRLHEYLQIVENHREKGRVRQRVVANLGKLDDLRSAGQVELLAASLARFSASSAVIGSHRGGELETVATRKIGAPFIFDRLWKDLHIDAFLGEMLRDCDLDFDVESAIYLSVLRRIIDPGSDRTVETWRQEYMLPPATMMLDPHQIDRAMAWLGGEVLETAQQGHFPFDKRCVGDFIEQRLFAHQPNAYTEAACMFFEVTLGRGGRHTDLRQNLQRMIGGLVLDGGGHPLFYELWPASATEATSLAAIVDCLRKQLSLSRITVISDRRIVNDETLAEFERLGFGYVLGSRKLPDHFLNTVPAADVPFAKVAELYSDADDRMLLTAKDLHVGGQRYVVSFNKSHALKDASSRTAILEYLENHFVREQTARFHDKSSFNILYNCSAALEKDETIFNEDTDLFGAWLLSTNLSKSTTDIEWMYKALWSAETCFDIGKSENRLPAFDKKHNETVRGHFYCGFLSLYLMRELLARLRDNDCAHADWEDVLRDLEALTQSEVVSVDGKRFLIRSESRGWCSRAFRAVGVELPPCLETIQGNNGFL